jgi:hypothetical protein
MKMPRRPFYPGLLPPDIFGLRSPGILTLESEIDTRKRVAAVERGVEATFRAAVEHLGELPARQLFAQVLRRSKRGRGKALAPDRDARLIREYDTAVSKSESVASLARRLHNNVGMELGNTPKAVETQIRKLVKERKQRERDAMLQARRWGMATQGEEQGLLSGTVPKK